MKFLAIRYDKQGSERRAAGDAAGAIALFEKAIEHAPNWSVPWYNMGLTYKYECRWEESYRCNAEAVRLNAGDEAAIWNLGIAATALGNWEEARRAWSLYGIGMPPGLGPIEMNLGTVPIRLNADRDGEVVWARRIDPARAVLLSVPLPESNHRHGDMVLHDGAAVGYRMLGDREVPVFNELELLAASNAGTFEVVIEVRTTNDLLAFEQACGSFGCTAEDWSAMRNLCRQCSEGRPHRHSEPQVEGEHRFGVAAANMGLVENAAHRWRAGDPTRAVAQVEVMLEPQRIQ